MALGLAQKHLDSAALDSPPGLTQERDREGALGHPSHAHPHMHVFGPDNLSHDVVVGEMEEVDYEGLQTDRLSAHLLAGGAAGMMEHCCMYPVDCVKTRMMALIPDPKANYKNLFQAFSRIVTQERPKALFRGIGIVASGAGPAHALYFSCYEFAKKGLTKSGQHSSVLAQGGAGAIATLVHDGLMNPIDVIKQRLQMYNSPYRGALHCARTVYRTEGALAFYRSYTTQLTMNIPFQMLHFVTYELLQDIFNYTRQYNPLSHMLSGAGAGALAAAITTPLDVAKTLLNTCEQTKRLSRDRQIHGMVHALRRIYQIGGFRGYLKGVTARVVYQVPSTAICWSVYEFFKYSLGLKEKEMQYIQSLACNSDTSLCSNDQLPPR